MLLILNIQELINLFMDKTMKIKFLIKEIKIEEVAKRLNSDKVYKRIMQFWEACTNNEKNLLLRIRYVSVKDPNIDQFFYDHFVKNKSIFNVILQIINKMDVNRNFEPIILNWIISYIIFPILKNESGNPYFSLMELLGGTPQYYIHLIESFFQYQRFVPEQFKDLMKIKSEDDLETIVEEAKIKHDEWLKNTKSAKLKKEAEYRKIFEDGEFKIYIPDNEQAACLLGMGTRWCTASVTSENYYDEYHKPNDPLFIFISKQNQSEKYQFHFGSGQYMDKDDQRIDYYTFEELYERYVNVLQKYNTEIAGANAREIYDLAFYGA